MAHGWDSYFHNLPPLPSDPSTLRRTSESEGSLSQHIENFIAHHDFPGTEASHEAPATNSDFNTSYYSSPSIVNSNSDCVYQKYYKETPWQADGEQIERNYLARCGNGDINFATDGLSTSESFPSSFATDLQGLKQDCGMLGTSFLENYSDVSSCSDADVGETRPSCKFMTNNSVPKPKTDVTVKHSSSEWLFTDSANMTFSTESACPNMPETHVVLPSPSNVKAGENVVECAQDKMENTENTIKSLAAHNQSSSTSNMVATTGSETVEDINYDGCKDQKQQEDVKRDLTQGRCSNLSVGGHENSIGLGIEKYPDGNEEEQITPTAPNVMTTIDKEQNHFDDKVVRKEINESIDQENEGFGDPNSADDQDKTVREDQKDETEFLKGERKESGSLEDENFYGQSPNPNSRKQIQPNTSQSTDPLGIKVSDCKSATHQLRVCTGTLKCNSHDVESCAPCVASRSELSLEPDSSNTDKNPCLEKERTSAVEKMNSTSPDPGCKGPVLSIDTSNNNKQGIASHVASCLQSSISSTDINPCLEKEMTSPPEKKMTPSPTDPDCSGSAITSDNKEQSVFDSSQFCLPSNTSSKDIYTCLEKEGTSPAENSNTIFFPEHQQSLQRSPVVLGQESLGENARESFEELDSSTEEASSLVALYGEPLSREDSSCDSDETKLDASWQKDTSVARPDDNSMNHSEGQAPHLMSSSQMRKQLQPIIILEMLEPVNGMSNSYHCGSCKHTTHSVDHLIEHHHCCHLVYNYQFCKTCNLYLMTNEQAEKHLCTVTKKSPQPSSNSGQQKKRKRRGHRCNKCGLLFSKLIQYISHMRTHTGKTPFKCSGCGLYFAQASSLQRHKRIPGRCKKPKSPVTNSDAVISKTKTPPQKSLVQTKLYGNLPKCYVKLVDISKTDLWAVCGRSFSTAENGTNFCNGQKGDNLAVSATRSITKLSCEESQKAENEDTGKYKCPLCPRLFKYSYNRARHLRDCVKESVCSGKEKISGKYRCPLCHATFTLASNRCRHINRVCLRECVNRLAKERLKSRQQTDQKKTKEIEQKTQSKENEQEKQAPPLLTAPKPIPRYQCNFCPAVFCHASGKYRHMKKHESFKLTGKMFRYRNSIFSVMSKAATISITKTEESEDNLKSTDPNSSLALSCHFCGKCFGTSQSLKKHERNHRGERPYRCLECGKGFKRRAYLIGHKIVHQRRIQCTVCNKILPTIGELIQHRSSHLNKGKLQCPDCHLLFQYPAHLLRHLNSHRKRENKAPQPERPKVQPQQSLESVKEQNGTKQLQCSLCKEVFNDSQVLRKHCLTHISGSSSNQCPFCRQNFTSRRYLLRHMIKHTGDKPFSCNNCGKQFYRHLYLELHSENCVPAEAQHLVKVVSDTKPKGSLQCSYCPRVFSKKIRLKNHHRGHNTNSLVLCSRCGQYFGHRKLGQHQKNCIGTQQNTGLSSPHGDFSRITSQTSQTVHKMVLQSSATKTLPFKCSYCTRRFRYRSLLFRHLVSHTGVQPYECVHCGHRYGTQTMCLQHEAFCDGVYREGQSKIKSEAAKRLSNMPTLREAAQKPQAQGEAEYKCKFCTKTFMKSRNLRRHILTHNEVKPYRCKACDSCFSRHDHLKVHQTRCKEKKSRLEVCIPKISLDDVGKGWQSKFGLEPIKKQETFDCGKKKGRKVTKETNASLPLETNPSTENVSKPLDGMKNRILERIQPQFKKKYKYVCSYCPRVFGNPYQLGVHTRLHTGERPYACDYCGQRFIRKDYLQRHFPKCTEKPQQNKALCDRCGGFFPQTQIENHKENCALTPGSSKSTVCQQPTSQRPTKAFSCAYCSSRFLLFSQLQEHFLNAHKMETMAPPVSTAPLQQHLLNIPNIKEEPLDESCDKQLSDGANLTCNLDTALGREVPKPFFCPKCNMSFISKAGLTGHLRVHTMEHPYNCKTCKRGFWNKSLLRNHYRKCRFGHTSERNTTQHLEVPLKAEIDFALNEPVLVFKESSKTTGTGVLQTNFSCKEDFMDESSQNSEGNEVQGSSSKGKKSVQYQCSECEKSFTDGLMLISHLEDHGRQEQEKKRNTCTKCGRVCASQGNLEKHMRMHGINKKYSCRDCSKTVYTLSDLEIHRACHDANRPYACKLCNQRFKTRPSLCNHYREEHPDDVFTCRFCNKAYSVKKSLARHYKKWHQKERKDLGSIAQEQEQQSSSQVSTTVESDEDENNGTEDSDSDSAPYFPCHVCGKTFTTSESLEDHQRCHLGEKPHECAECGRCFFQASQLQQHQRMHKSEFQCQACGRGFVSLFALRKHKHTHGKSRPYRCSKCHLSFTGLTQLAEHMSTHREENFPCDICNRVFLSKISRAEHRKSHAKSGDLCPPSALREEYKKSASLSEKSLFNKELKYRCGVCSERFKDPEKLSEHGCMAAKERPYSCLECDKHFLHASHLKKHRNTHHLSVSSDEYPCNQCSSSFSSCDLFLSHLKSHVDTTEGIKCNTEDKDGRPSNSFLCPVCHQCFASATELIDHFPIHIGSTFECKICKMIFSSGHELEEHERHHLTSATEFECTECGQSFLGSDAFRQHHCSRQQHAKMDNKYVNPLAKTSPTYPAPGEEEEVDVTGEDLYYCPVCSMQFSSKSSLLEHQNKEHSNEKPFKCELCGKAFALRMYLKNHERRHRQKFAAQKTTELTENKLKCAQCHIKFSTAQDLSLHMRLHAEKEVGEYRCDMCYKSFRQWSVLKQHQESHVGQVVYECTECDKAFAFPHLLEEHQQTHVGSSQ